MLIAQKQMPNAYCSPGIAGAGVANSVMPNFATLGRDLIENSALFFGNVGDCNRFAMGDVIPGKLQILQLVSSQECL
jgi:hypothetical protein